MHGNNNSHLSAAETGNSHRNPQSEQEVGVYFSDRTVFVCWYKGGSPRGVVKLHTNIFVNEDHKVKCL